MNERSQCSTANGVCPDIDRSGAVNDVSEVSGDRVDGITLVRYKKPLIPTDIDETATAGAQTTDHLISVVPGETTFVVWAIGPVDVDTGYPYFHSVYPSADVAIEFGRDIVDNCVSLNAAENAANDTAESTGPFDIPILQEVTEFTVRIGPSGGDRGYAGITNSTSWGIAFYLNDLLIPMIEMRRGTTYTFLVNGGNDINSSAMYHPFYITTSATGGFVQLDPEERLEETVYAGIEVTERDSNGGIMDFNSTVQGPICFYKETDASEEAKLSGDFQEFFDTLDTSCKENITITDAAGRLEFTPDADTPDLLYYHCVTHRSLGWKIRVLDADEPALTPTTAFAPVAVPTPTAAQSNVPRGPPTAPTLPTASSSAMATTTFGGLPTLLMALFAFGMIVL
jgi:hypothetical protein